MLQFAISIHSTTRVETYNTYHFRCSYPYFNPLHHEGGDAVQGTKGKLDTLFQSTPPRGWRRNGVQQENIAKLFQSTPPRGWRLSAHVGIWFLQQISIHSTTRVETIYHLLYRQSFPYFNPLHHEGGDGSRACVCTCRRKFQSTPPRGWRQQYYTITTTILQHISTNKSYPTPSNHGQPSLYTRKSVLIVQIFRCESPRKSMFASGSHQNTLYRFTARGQVRISAVLPH